MRVGLSLHIKKPPNLDLTAFGPNAGQLMLLRLSSSIWACNRRIIVSAAALRLNVVSTFSWGHVR